MKQPELSCPAAISLGLPRNWYRLPDQHCHPSCYKPGPKGELSPAVAVVFGRTPAKGRAVIRSCCCVWQNPSRCLIGCHTDQMTKTILLCSALHTVPCEHHLERDTATLNLQSQLLQPTQDICMGGYNCNCQPCDPTTQLALTRIDVYSVQIFTVES